MSLRETSLRAIARVLAAPTVCGALGLEHDELPLMGEDVHYLRAGAGLMVYVVRGAVASMHGALLPGDGHNARELWPQHLAYLRGIGVEKITTRHRADHRRASFMCRALGFAPVACDDGFKRYERII